MIIWNEVCKVTPRSPCSTDIWTLIDILCKMQEFNKSIKCIERSTLNIDFVGCLKEVIEWHTDGWTKERLTDRMNNNDNKSSNTEYLCGQAVLSILEWDQRPQVQSQ